MTNESKMRGFVWFERVGSNKQLTQAVAKLQQKCATDLDNNARARRVARTLREATE